MVITANAREIGALLKTFKDKILEKAAKLTVANSLKLEGKTLAEVAAMGGGSSDSTELVAAINEVATEFSAIPAIWSGDITVGSVNGGLGYADALVTGGAPAGDISSTVIDTDGIIHAIVFDSSTTPDTLILMVEVNFSDPNAISEIEVHGRILDTLNSEVQAIPYNGKYIHQYQFVATSLSAPFVDSIGSVFTVEIR